MLMGLAPAADFPRLRDITYLNSASVSVVPQPVVAEVEAFHRQIGSQGTLSFGDEEEARVYDGARGEIAAMIHARPEDVALMSSATECIGQIAWWLRPGKGKNVVSADIEFPSVTYPWLQVAKATGGEVRLARALERPEDFSLEAIARLVDKNTAAISISHVQYATGHRLDPVVLADLAHAHGALLVLDVTQSAGVIPIDVRAAHFDVVLGSSYKWMCGPFCSAFCYLHPDIWRDYEPPFAGWHSTNVVYHFDATRIDLAASARRMEYSTVSYGAGLGLAAAARYLQGIGMERIHRHDLDLARQLMDGLEKLGATLITPRAEEQRAAIVCARFPKPAHEIAAALREKQIHCAPRLGALRISPHFFNTQEHIAQCLAAIAS